ncbi:MAG TPA: hypothetical protein VGT04_03330 [Acidobacteriaceae bacterium]|nr:hypothetical protein [Acidobacteriaceae bacterium]
MIATKAINHIRCLGSVRIFARFLVNTINPGNALAHSRETLECLGAGIKCCMEPKPAAANISESSLIGGEFLISDARTALTLLDLSQSAASTGIHARRVGEAYKAYRSVLSFMQRLDPTAEQMNILNNEVETLAQRLKAAGMHVD